jgi:hypothetical protein
MVGDGEVLFVEGAEVFEGAVEDLDFAGGGDVADAPGLVRSEKGRGFAEG